MISGRTGLAGLRVIVTRAREQAAGLTTRLEELGAAVIHLPSISIVPPGSWEEADAAALRLAAGDYSWVAFTSLNGVTRFLDRLEQLEVTIPAATKVAAVGRSTAHALAGRGVDTGLVPDRFTAMDLARRLGPGSGRILTPRAAGAPQDMPRALRRAGWAVDEVAVYRTAPAPGDTPAVRSARAGHFDVVTFSSASTVRYFVNVVGPPSTLGLAPAGSCAGATRVVACIGPVTAEAALSLGVRVDLVAPQHTADGLVAALRHHFG
ncbi:MAG: uroporphyrinogen-III synthase [Actinobacteria bacterium]|nr:uroporphyrinogen-III synthase [Actinomycetota bacterium]